MNKAGEVKNRCCFFEEIAVLDSRYERVHCREEATNRIVDNEAVFAVLLILNLKEYRYILCC